MPSTTTLGVTRETKAKLDAIRLPRRWNIKQAIDAIIDDFAARNRIDVPASPAASSLTGEPAASIASGKEETAH